MAAPPQTAAADNSAATLVTLHVKDAPAADVYGEIARQANLHIAPVSDRPWPALPNVTIDVEQQPLWQVMHRLAEQTGLAPAPFKGGIYLSVRPGWAKAPSYYNGGVLFVAYQANINQSVNLTDQSQNQGGIALYIYANVDPKIDILQVLSLHVDEALDENGKLLVPKQDWGGEIGSIAGTLHLGAQFLYSPDIGKRIARFRGSFRFALCTRREAWEVNDIRSAKDVVHKMALGTYIVKSVENPATDATEYLVKIQIEGTASPSSPLFSGEAISRSIRLVDAIGREYTSAGSGGMRMNGHLEWGITFRDAGNAGQKLGPPSKLIWQIPVEFKEIVVPVELSDIPLPAFRTSGN